MAKTEAPANAEAPKPKGKKMLVIIIVAVVLLIGIGGAAAFFLLSKPSADKQAKHDAEEEPAADEEEEEEDSGEEHPPIYEQLPVFTVNLADRESYLQVEIHLRVAEPKVQEKLKQRMSEVRDEILRVLSSKNPEELATQEGKDALAADLQKKINGVIGVKKASKGVKKVLFNSFIIQ